jgi:hypothetical protein
VRQIALYPEFRVVVVREEANPLNALEGKVTLVTGAKGGLGSFVTERLPPAQK